MNDDDMDLRAGELVNAVRHGPGPLLYHVHEQEDRIRRLVHISLDSTRHFDRVAVHMDQFRGSIRIPDGSAAHAIPAPDSTVQGWEWDDGRSLLLMPFAQDGLPKLARIGTEPEASQVTVADHPMQVVLHGTASPFVAIVHGYLSNTLGISINISAPTTDARASLIAAVSTLAGTTIGV